MKNAKRKMENENHWSTDYTIIQINTDLKNVGARPRVRPIHMFYTSRFFV